MQKKCLLLWIFLMSAILFPQCIQASTDISTQILPASWQASWASDPQGTVRAILYNFPAGYANTDIVAGSVNFNETVSIVGNQLLLRPSYPGISGQVAIASFNRQSAVQAFGDCLANGDHVCIISGNFSDGEEFTANSIISLSGGVDDLTPPEIHILNPADGQVISTNQPLIEISYSDDCSGVNPGQLLVELDAVDITSRFAIDEANASYQISSGEALSGGSHILTASIVDYSGNTSSTTSSFSVMAGEIDSVTAEITPDGGTIELPGIASVTFPEGAFDAETDVMISTKSMPSNYEEYDDFLSKMGAGPRLNYELEIDIGFQRLKTDFIVSLTVAQNFIDNLPSDYEIAGYVRVYQGGGEETIDMLERCVSEFDPLSRQLAITLPWWIFSNTRNIQNSYTAELLCGSAKVY